MGSNDTITFDLECPLKGQIQGNSDFKPLYSVKEQS